MGYTLELPSGVVLRLMLIEKLIALTHDMDSGTQIHKTIESVIQGHLITINSEIEKEIGEL